ncbi:hypothetical protein FRC04_005253 [Tulasnella sp. 424]|nr:hypothetical protein FRC04_005253 [Tulasnella sp. 424]KAG8962790.1 hypothetical protein FRC05_005114 [Tulasnella sp. 425]
MAQPGAAHPETLTDLTFSGASGTECENFIRFVKRKAFAEQKSRDNEWMAYFASTCFTGAALRWYESLDDDTQYNWKLLSKALLAKYPATYGEDIIPINPSPMSSGGHTPSPPVQDTRQYAAQPPVAPIAGGGYMPGSWLPMAAATPPPPPPKNQDPPSNMTIPAAPPPRANSTQPSAAFASKPVPARPSVTASSLLNAFRKLNLTGTHRGRISVRCDISAEDGYIARKITKESAGLLFGFHVVTKSVIDSLQVEFTQPPPKPPSAKPHIFKLLVGNNSSAKGFEFLGITWFERQPNYLGKGPGHTAYSHLAAVKGKEAWELESSYQNNDDGSYGDHDSDFNIVGKEIWRVSQSDGQISAWWSDYGGQLHELEFAVCLHDKELYFVSDYGEFAKLYGPSSYTRAKLVFEPL